MPFTRDAAARKDANSAYVPTDGRLFTHRHYAPIAAALAAQRAIYLPFLGGDKDEEGSATYLANLACDEIARTATALADVFERDNLNFNRVRFFLAADCEDQK